MNRNRTALKLPFLDTQMWIEEETGRVLWKHFEKPMNSRTVMSMRSALDGRTKRTIHTQEVLRIYRNTHRDVEAAIINEDISNYMKKLQNSGYPKEYRKEILVSGKKAWDEMVKAEMDGTKPVYRARKWREEERREKKKRAVDTWFTKGGFESMIFVPATPGMELKKKIQKEMDEMNMKVKVVEARSKIGGRSKTKCEERKNSLWRRRLLVV